MEDVARHYGDIRVGTIGERAGVHPMLEKANGRSASSRRPPAGRTPPQGIAKTFEQARAALSSMADYRARCTEADVARTAGHRAAPPGNTGCTTPARPRPTQCRAADRSVLRRAVDQPPRSTPISSKHMDMA